MKATVLICIPQKPAIGINNGCGCHAGLSIPSCAIFRSDPCSSSIDYGSKASMPFFKRNRGMP
jgi:hypothetical protein